MPSTRLDPYERLYSAQSSNLRSSAMRDLMAVTSRPEVISLAGGLPDTRSFPADLLAELMETVARQHGPRALQYGPTEGIDELRDELAARMRADGVDATSSQVIVTAGGQQAIDLTLRTLVDPGDVVLAEGPTYPGAVPSFGACGADVRQVPMDADGLRIDLLVDAYDRAVREERTPKLVYTIPTFQNPGGATMSTARRHELTAFARDRDLLVVEDDPYGRLRYRGEPVPLLASLDGEGRTISLGTMSKTFSPGIRVGWIRAPHQILRRVNLLKQGADLCSSTLSQLLALSYLRSPREDEVLARLRGLYEARLAALTAAVEQHLPDASFTIPDGGLFLWVTLTDGLDTTDLLAAALERDVAFVPGRAAYLDGTTGSTSMRLNFSTMDEERIEEGVRRIGEVVRDRAALSRALHRTRQRASR